MRWRTRDENMRWITTKRNNGPNFQYAKFTVNELVLPDRRNLSGTRENRTVANPPTVYFRLRQNRRQVASFLYAQPLCIENWIRNKSFKNCFNVGSVTKKLRIWNFDGLRTSIFYQFGEWKFPKPPYEVSTVGRLVDSNHNRPRTPVQLECN